MKSTIFFGSSPFSNIALQKLVDAGVDISAVVTNPDKPSGRHLKVAQNSVKVLAVKNNLNVVEKMSDLNPSSNTIGIVAAYGQIIPKSLIDRFDGEIYNIHPSLLPKYRGPSPLQQQVLDGVAETGVTIIRIDERMDHGPIVAQEEDTPKPDDTTQSLGERLFAKGAELFIKSVLNASSVETHEQAHSQASYTRLLTRQDGFVPWEEFKPQNLDSKFRAFYPWPGVWTRNPQGQRVKLVSLNPFRSYVAS